MAFVIAAPTSSSGKTLLSILLLSWARERRKTIQPFKVGPDYLDPQMLTLISEKDCINLDPVLCGEQWVKDSFSKYSGSAELSLIEGVMGAFDGIGSSSIGSTADVAKKLNLPLILIINAHGQAGSITALVKGFIQFDPRIKFAGVVLNNINSNRHKEILVDALSNINVKVLGCIPKNDYLKIKSNYLGLIPAHEVKDLSSLKKIWANMAEEFLDMESFQYLMRPNKHNDIKSSSNQIFSHKKQYLPIAIAQDKVFHFRYPETKEYLERLGMQLINWEITKDYSIPKEALGLILPGGFPEKFSEEISQCEKSLNSIKSLFGRIPIYAECGGMLILGKELSDIKGNSFPMADILPFNAKLGQLNVGYRKIKGISNGLISNKGEVYNGHEFHRWEIKPIEEKLSVLKKNKIIKSNNNDLLPPWEISGWGTNKHQEGWSNKNFHASWMHLHWPSSPAILNNWTRRILNQANF